MNKRWVGLTALALGVTGLAGIGGGVAAQYLSGDTVLEGSVPEAPPPGRGKKARPRPVVHRYDVRLDEAMNPIVGTVSVSAGGLVTLRIVDPTGAAIHDRRYGDPMTQGKSSSVLLVPPIEITNPGDHHVEFEVDPRSAAAFELRRNAIAVSNAWLVASVGMSMLAFGMVFVRVMRRANRLTGLALAWRRAHRAGDAS